MSLFRRHRWFFAATGITLAYAVVSLTVHRSPALTAFGDLIGLLEMLAAAGITLSAALTASGKGRSFWALMSLGFLLWGSNQGAWGYYEVVLRQRIPDPCFFDVILFFHLVPMIAAVAWRPDVAKKETRFPLSTLNFSLLLGWWIFLYAFIVFPHQYIVLDIPSYDRYYELLYLFENALLLVLLGFAAVTSFGDWRRLYLHFLVAGSIYGAGSQLLNRAVSNGSYYTGSLYDVPLVGAVAWMGAASLTAREWNLKSVPPHPILLRRQITAQLAMLAILSLPVLGLWAVLGDTSPGLSRLFRIFAVLTAMLVLGAFVFLRQYIQDQALIGLLKDSRNSYENQQRLQTHLVQKEKLASLGTLIAGAASEIDHPLTAIMDYSEQLWSKQRLHPEQDTMVRKIVNQAQRTRDLVGDLLSFAQQSPGEKALLDLNVLLHRSAQIMEARHHSNRIRVEIAIQPGFPRIRGNANQLFQTFVEIVENAMDALEETGGTLRITAQMDGGDAVLQFSDNGPGIKEPQRVFDPFYTTKPVGRGTGLGLSAVYGVVQDHDGQITCQNKPGGGALFVLRFPAAAEPSAQAASAKA